MRMCKETKKIIDICVAQGLVHRVTQNCHHQVRNAEGRVLAGMSGTASDFRAVKNFRAQLKRAGVTGL